MEESTARNVVFFAALETNTYEHLSTLRTWNHLEMGREDNTIWLKNLNYEQINSRMILQIPFVQRYYGKKGKLFPYERLLPERNIPDITWESITEQTALTLPAYNFNYFSSSEKIAIKIVPSNQEKPTVALLTTLPLLTEYLSTAPAIRYQHLKWVLINDDEVFLLGTPLLPIPGKSLWQNGAAFIPAGYDFELPIFANTVTQKLVNSENKFLIWNEIANYFFIQRGHLNYLDLAAVRKQKT